MTTDEQIQAIVSLNRRPAPMCDMVWSAQVRQAIAASGVKYITRAPWAITTRYGVTSVHNAMLGDGSSGPALDRCPRAYWAHDKLYIYPMVIGKDGKCRILNKFQCDLAYASLLTRNWMPVDAAISFTGLTIGGFGAWNKYKRLRKSPGTNMILEGFTLPHRELWEVPSNRIEDIRFKKRNPS